MEILSVARSYSHRGNHRHREGTKRRWYAYFMTPDGRFGRKRISPLSVAFYKARIKKHIQLVCADCSGVFQCYYRNDKDLNKEVCPYCASPVTGEELPLSANLWI